MTTIKAKANDGDEANVNRPKTDQWGQEVKHFPADAVGAGEARECQSCGERFEIAMIAATEDTSSRYCLVRNSSPPQPGCGYRVLDLAADSCSRRQMRRASAARWLCRPSICYGSV